jgi:hypothetical protein
MLKNPKFQNIFSIILAVVIFLVLSALYFGEINLLNLIGAKLGYTSDKLIDIDLTRNGLWTDILVGLTIYLKTAVDFAIVIGLLMSRYKGFKNRVAIENGTALGNTLGTMTIALIWFFFKEVKWLLALMVIIASFVLFELAQGGVEHIEEAEKEGQKVPHWVKLISNVVDKFLKTILTVISPVLSKVMPSMKFDETKELTFKGLIMASFTIPFILGLDDFAGYVPLFNVVNLFGFGVGVFLGHCILNILLFVNPQKTIQIVKNPVISLLGSIFFIGLAFYGLYEAGHSVAGMFLPHETGEAIKSSLGH